MRFLRLIAKIRASIPLIDFPVLKKVLIFPIFSTEIPVQSEKLWNRTNDIRVFISTTAFVQVSGFGIDFYLLGLVNIGLVITIFNIIFQNCILDKYPFVRVISFIHPILCGSIQFFAPGYLSLCFCFTKQI